jgi:hypothetical protein
MRVRLSKSGIVGKAEWGELLLQAFQINCCYFMEFCIRLGISSEELTYCYNVAPVASRKSRPLATFLKRYPITSWRLLHCPERNHYSLTNNKRLLVTL